MSFIEFGEILKEEFKKIWKKLNELEKRIKQIEELKGEEISTETIRTDIWRKMPVGNIINSIAVAILFLKNENIKLNENQKEQLLSLIREIIDLILQKGDD